MYKESKRIALGLFFMTLAWSFYGYTALPQISTRLQKKIDRAIKTTYGIDSFKMLALQVPKALNSETLADFDGDKLFKISKNEKTIGYFYLGEAPSMKNVFDYIILFTPNLTIKKSKVLIYREDYGLQIGSQRWLKQFIGLEVSDVPTYGEDIDAIAGATISAKSMTKATANVLKSMQLLKERKLL